MSKEQEKLNELLYVALRYNDCERAEKFILEGADVNGYYAEIRHFDGRHVGETRYDYVPFIHCSLSFFEIEPFKLLLKYGVNVNCDNGCEFNNNAHHFNSVSENIDYRISCCARNYPDGEDLPLYREMKRLLTEYESGKTKCIR